MRPVHFDCFSGISGDMTLGALIDAGVDAEAVRTASPRWDCRSRLEVEKVRKGGFAATHVRIEAPEEHEHRHLPDVEEILSRGRLTRDAARAGPAHLPPPGRGRGDGPRHAAGEGPFPRSRRPGQHRRHRRGGHRPRSARRRALHQPVRCRPAAARSSAPTASCRCPAPGTAELLKGVPLARVADQGRADDADRGRDPDDASCRSGSSSRP